MNKASCLQPFYSRRGFTVYLLFLMLFFVLMSAFLSQSIEILALARMQSEIIKSEGEIRSGNTWYLENLLGPAELSTD